MSAWKKSASVAAKESALMGHGLDLFLERFVLLECAPDCIVVGLLSLGGLSEFLVVDTLGLILPLACQDDGLHGCVCGVAFGNQRRTFSNCFCNLLCVRNSVCCSRSCNLCTAFRTTLSGAGSWGAGSGGEVSSQPWWVPLHPFHQLEELPLLMGATKEQRSAYRGKRGAV